MSVRNAIRQARQYHREEDRVKALLAVVLGWLVMAARGCEAENLLIEAIKREIGLDDFQVHKMLKEVKGKSVL